MTKKPQTHDPELFRVASLLASHAMVNDPKSTNPYTRAAMWIEATPEATTFYTSNESLNLAVTCPTWDPGDTWNAVIADPSNDFVRIGKTAATATKRWQQVLPGFEEFNQQVRIHPPDIEMVTVESIGDNTHRQLTSKVDLPIVDIDWPSKGVAVYDRLKQTSVSHRWPSPLTTKALNAVWQTMSPVWEDYGLPPTMFATVDMPGMSDTDIFETFDFEHPTLHGIRVRGYATVTEPASNEPTDESASDDQGETEWGTETEPNPLPKGPLAAQ